MLAILGVVVFALPPQQVVARDAEATGVKTAGQAAAAETRVAADVPQDWWSQVQKQLAQSEYHVTWQKETLLPGVGAAWQAPNRAHDLRTYFTPHGPRVVRRTQEKPEWVWGLELVGYGGTKDEGGRRKEELALPPAPDVEDTVTNGNRIEFHRGTLVEWYVNDPKGLEQGFTISDQQTVDGNQRSSTQHSALSTQHLVLDLTVRSDLIPNISADGQTVEFLTAGGVAVIHYGHLNAHDATGRQLPARMELMKDSDRMNRMDGIESEEKKVFDPANLVNPVKEEVCSEIRNPQPPESKIENLKSKIRIVVDATGAAYPITIDPLATSAAWTAESNQDDTRFGISVATAGDVNGDGYADVIVGAPYYDNGQPGEGRAFVYRGSASGLSLWANWTAESDQVGAHFGYSVATAGDVNGDGYGDVIVGAPYYSNVQTYEGRVFVWFGSASGLGANGTPTNADWTAESDQVGAEFGYSVATAGDVNGDGYGDVIVGADRYGNGQTDEGRAFVWFGSASGLGANGTPANANWTAESDQASAWFGCSVATAGDVNGDGYGDVIVGASSYSNDQTNEGRAFVYHGSASGLSTTANWIAESDQALSQYGASVATAGDVNGDGYGDVIVGAYKYSNDQPGEGRVFVYHGSPTGLSPTANWTAESNQASAFFGGSVSTAGDVNGDGYADVIVGADGYDNGQTDEGRAFVWLGSASGLGANGTPANADWTAEGDQDGASFGYSVATAGDVNGDGYSDVIVGAHCYNNGQTEEGRAFVWFGSASGLGANGTPANAAWTAEGDQDGAVFGTCVATAGDVNGDGYSDVIVGAPDYNNGQTDEGRAFVYHGSASGLSALPNWTAESNQANAHFGGSVATAGDVNGDGYADVIVGAPDYDYGQTDEGGAFVYYGNGEAGRGLSLNPRQRRMDNSAPVAPMGMTDNEAGLRLAALGRTPFGRGKVKLECEVKRLGTLFDGTGTVVTAAWQDTMTAGVNLVKIIDTLTSDTSAVYHWRARLRHHPATTPYQQHSRWLTMPWNGWEEGDFRVPARVGETGAKRWHDGYR